jgi:mRNA-degrading endonuclease HigB of HigAB toxin-antitoxin module
VGDYTVFNIAGTKYRLVAEMFRNTEVLPVRGAYTHKDHDELGL